MPRQPRLIITGQYYHIIARGNNRQWLFNEAKDFEYYLQGLDHYLIEFQVSLLHYCFMSNHVHMLMRCDGKNGAISRLMKGVQMVYARYFKKKHGATGHVFEDRFKSWLIDNDAYLLECGRYIENNPVRAKMVSAPELYPWSSYLHYGGYEKQGRITTNPGYLSLGLADGERIKAYQAYVNTRRAYEDIVDQYIEERVLM